MARGKIKPVEEKLKIVLECLDGEISVSKCARKYETNKSAIDNWIRLYKAHGIEGLVSKSGTLRYSIEIKSQVVKECIDGETSQRQCAQKYGISESTILNWIQIYRAHGIDELNAYSRRREYTIELQTRAVKNYLSGGGSLHAICRKYDISSSRLLQKWIECYNNRGTLKQPKKGGAVSMVKSRDTTLDERIEIVSHCIANNMNYRETIDRYNVSYGQLCGWVKKYEKDGPGGLIDRRGKRKSKESMTEVEKLRAALKLKEAENYRLQMENDLLKKLEEIERGRSQD